MKKSEFNRLTAEEKERYMRLLARTDPALHRIMSQAGGKRGGPKAAAARKKNAMLREFEREHKIAEWWIYNGYPANEHTHPVNN